MSLKKQINQIIEEFKERGWTFERVPRNSHWRCQHKNGGLTFIASTPSDHRAIQNIKSILRRLETNPNRRTYENA